MKTIIILLLAGNCLLDAASPNIEMIQIVNGSSFEGEWVPSPTRLGSRVYSFVSTAAIIAYLGTAAYTLHARYMLNDMTAWNNWRNSISLTDLASIPQKELSDMLVKSISIHYNCPPGTILMNIPLFLRDTCNEINTLTTYKTIGHFLQSFYLAPLAFITKDSLAQAEEKIKRLQFMQTIVATDLEPTDTTCRLDIIDHYQTSPTSMQHASNRHR
jgi:hypothetical protein